MSLSPAARALLGSDALAHMVTVNADGSPSVAVVWVGVDGDEIVVGHLDAGQHKLRNLRRDPRVVLSVESSTTNAHGLREYLVVHGTARLTEGGAPELLAELARTYIGPDAVFPPMADPPPGVVTRIVVDRVGGIGDWEAPAG